jgi:hypothetical protein
MRLAAQMRGGFYPAHPNAIARTAAHLRPPREPFTILDPCAGEGAALHQLGELLGCPPAQRFAIELDEHRSDAVRAALPDAQILAPASFFGCRASYNAFSCIWLNPPFDDAYGGHRVEEQFLLQATDWLMPGGVMALVCPEDVVDEYTDAREHFTVYYEQCKIVPFPDDCRPYREVVVFGHKRPRPQVDRTGSPLLSWEAIQAPEGFVFRIPPGPGPRLFRKVEPTEPELQHMLAESPLRSHLSEPPAPKLPVPPLALGVGHVALLLASGHLDGVVSPEGKPPHVVRGTSRKREFVAGVTETENDDGTTTTRTTLSERIDLVIRTVDLTGEIRTFQEADADADGNPPPTL